MISWKQGVWQSRHKYTTACISCILCCFFLLLTGCSKPFHAIPEQDGAPKKVPHNLDKVPDPIPKCEPLSKYGNRFKKNSTSSYVALKRRYTVMPTSKGYCAQGQASWYGTKFQGKRTSSGEPYDMFAMTAAHRTLPLPTYARVTNVDNGKTVIVKVNDRGPFHNNRLIDLSYVAAHKLGILGKGTGRVKVESIDPRDHGGKVPGQKRNFFARNNRNNKNSDEINATEICREVGFAQAEPIASNSSKTPKTSQTPKLYLQVGAFNQKSHAESLLNEVSKLSKLSKYSGSIATQKQNKKSLFKVRLGPFENQQQLKQATKALVAANLPTPVTVRE